MNRETAIERIRKLLAMTKERGATEAEALQAALMAQKLIAEYDVGKDEIYEETKPELVTIASGVRFKRPFGTTLSTIVAENFRCIAFTTRYPDGNREPEFYGYDADAEAASLTFAMLYKVGNRLANKAARDQKKKYGYSDGAYNSFAHGFLDGVKEELEIQTKALMLVRPKAVDEGFEELSKSFEFSYTPNMRSSHSGFYDDGRRAAHDAIKSHRMDGQLALA